MGIGNIPFSRPPDLPLATTMCANCGQLLDPSMGLPPHAEFVPDGDWDGPSVTGVMYYSCPRCDVDLSDTPPHRIVITHANAYPEIKNLIKEKYNLQTLIHIHKRNLRVHQQQLAMAGPLDSRRVTLENCADFERKQITTLTQQLHTVEQKIASALRDLLR